MSLKIIGWKKIIARSIWGLIILMATGFIARTAIWENNYYASKEGSERAVVMAFSNEDELTEQLVEEQPTPEVVIEYTVREGYPRYMSIPDLGIVKSRIIELQTKRGSNELGTPNNIYDVGWYGASNKPGEGGNILMDGHSGGPNEVGVFKYLPTLSVGSRIEIEVGGGAIYTYEVVENLQKSLVEGNKYMSTALHGQINGKETLTIITCTGEWSAIQNTFLSRQFVRAVLVE